MKSETRSVKKGDVQINYNLITKKVKNINLTVKLTGEVMVCAKGSISKKYIDDFVLSKMDFILKAQNKFNKINKYENIIKNYEDGDVFYYLGKKYTLIVIKGDKDKVYLQNDNMILEIKNSDYDTLKKEKIVNKFYDEKSKETFEYFIDNVGRVFIKKGIQKPELKIRLMKARWGSCNIKTKTITLNKKLIEAPIECIAYVVVHEFCHFIYANHSKDFYNLVSEYIPDYKNIRKVLNERLY